MALVTVGTRIRTRMVDIATQTFSISCISYYRKWYVANN